MDKKTTVLGNNEITNRKKRVVLNCKLSLEEAQAIIDTQKRKVRTNQRRGEETALKKALKGSEIYLKKNGFI